MSIVTRTNTSYHSPRNLIPMTWGTAGTVFNPAGGHTNPFSVTASVNPNTSGPNGGPISIVQATCRAGIDGNLTVGLTNGFTAPVTLTAWEFNRVANAWMKVGPAAAIYAQAMDDVFTQWTFNATESAVILIQSSAAITGNAYTDGTIDSPRVGAQLEGQ